MGLGLVDCCPGGAVDDDIGLECGQGGGYRLRVGDVDVRAIKAEDDVTITRRDEGHELRAKLPERTGDESAHC